MDKSIKRITIALPDGEIIGAPVAPGLDASEVIERITSNWYRVSKEKPHLFDHVDSENICPRCGTRLRARHYKSDIFEWCPNYPECEYRTVRYK